MVSTNGNPVAGRGRGRYGATRPDGRSPADNGRELPWSEEAEQHVIACALLEDSDALDRAKRAGITPDSFFSAANRTLWSVMVDLHVARPPVTLMMLVEELKLRRLLDAVGGLAYLMQLTGSIPTAAHAGYFIERLVELEGRRQIIQAATRVVEGAYAYTGGGFDAFEPLTSGIETLERVRARGRGELPPVLAWKDFVPEAQTQLPEELVEGVLHRGAKLMIAGGSKSFKTWVLLHLGLSVASGKPWWGMRTQKGRVLYLNLELMRGFCEVRVRQIAAAMKVENCDGFDSWHLRGYARDFTQLLPHIVALTARGQYALIILDPVYKILGERDENANGEVAQLLNEFEALAVRSGAAVAYGHHHSKGNQSEKDARDRSSGAGAWTRDPDALIDMTPHEEENHFVATFTLRNHAPKSPMVVEWEFPVMSIAPGMDPTALRKAGRPKEHGVASVVTLLMGREPGLSYGEWEELAKKKGISESSFKRLRAQAVAENKVVQAAGLYRLCQGKES